MLQLDDTDLRLLKILHNDSKLTVKELAAQVNLSPSPVLKESDEWRKKDISRSILPFWTQRN